MPINIQLPLGSLEDPKVARALANLMLTLSSKPTHASQVGLVATESTASPSADQTKVPLPTNMEASIEAGGLATSEPLPGLVAVAGAASQAEVVIETDSPDEIVGRVTEPSVVIEAPPWPTTASSETTQTTVVVEAPDAMSLPAPTRPVVAQREAPAPVVTAPTPATIEPSPPAATAPPAPLERAVVKRAPSAAKARTEPRAPASAEAVAVPAESAEKPTVDPALGERFSAFVESLPMRSQHFIRLVRERGTLTITDAMVELEISVPKAMGGITGSIGRWAPERGVAIPYEAITTPDGVRAWRWRGIRQAPDRPEKKKKASSQSRVGQRQAKKDAKVVPEQLTLTSVGAATSQAPSSVKADATVPPGKPARPTRRAEAEAPVAVAAPVSPVSEEPDEASAPELPPLPETTEAEVAAAKPAKAEVSAPAPVEAKPATVEKAVQAEAQPVVPVVPIVPEPDEAELAAIEPKKAAKPAREKTVATSDEKTPHAKASGGTDGKLVKAAPEAPAVEEPSAGAPTEAEFTSVPEPVTPSPLSADDDRYGDFLDALPKQSRRFMQMLRERRTLSMSEVLNAFGLARAKAVGGIIEPVNRIAVDYGFERAFESASTETGERLWLWPGTEMKEPPSAPKPPSRPMLRVPRSTPAESTPSGRPGVRVRRRGGNS